MKKKGFTLIELLAVIVILGIIALIATPLVLNYIEYSKKESLKNNILSIDRAILMKGTIDRKDKEYTSLDELKMEINDFEMKVQYVDGINRFYKIENDMYKLDIKKCKAKKYCTIGEIKSIKDIIISTAVNDSNPGIICGEGLEEDTSISTCYIKSIEDLVALSTLVNKGTTFKDKTIELVNDLDFNNKKSYANKKIDNSLVSGEGFTPIGYSSSKSFQGTFNGNNNTIKGLYINRPEISNIGLFGVIDYATIKYINIENCNITGDVRVGCLSGSIKNSLIANIKVSDAKINGGSNGGISDYFSTSTANNIDLKNVNINSTGSAGGVFCTAHNSSLSKAVLTKINVISATRNVGGLIGSKANTTISVAKLTDIYIESQGGYTGGIVGGNNSGSVSNVKFKGDVYSPGAYAALAVGYNAADLNNIAVSGNVGNSAYTGAIAGRTNGTADNMTNITAVMLSGDVKGHSYSNKMIAAIANSNLNLLVSKDVLFNDKVVESNDPTSLNGKSLDNMGKVSQSEYEALGFEFESTDTNEAYWYFNEDDELDLIIK